MSYLKVEIISFNPNSLKTFIKKISLSLGIKNVIIISIPKKRKIFSILKSPFVNNKAIEQFSIKKYKKLLVVKQVYQEKLKQFLDQIPLKNIAIKVKKIV